MEGKFTDSALVAADGPEAWAREAAIDDDTLAIQVLRTGGSIAILFLLAYLAYDLHLSRGRFTLAALYHWVTIVAVLLFFGLTWTRGFRRYWKFWNLAFCIALVTIFILISRQTREGDSRYIAVLLFPIATASFVNWGWRWQALMGFCSIAMYAVAEMLVPLPGSGSVYRWLGLLAAVVLAEATAIFLERYRTRLRAQVLQLLAAAQFRRTQISTMAHDIRNPVAAIAGFIDLLEDDDLPREDRENILTRIGTTAWNMDLTVSTVLDLYRIQDGRVPFTPTIADPNQVVAEAVSGCAAQAVRKDLKLTASYGEIPPGGFDRGHVNKIVRNLLAFSIARMNSGEIVLKTSAAGATMQVEIEDQGPALGAPELNDLLEPREDQRSGGSPSLGIYVASVLARTSGGWLRAYRRNGVGVRFVAEIPPAKPEQIASAS